MSPPRDPRPSLVKTPRALPGALPIPPHDAQGGGMLRDSKGVQDFLRRLDDHQAMAKARNPTSAIPTPRPTWRYEAIRGEIVGALEEAGQTIHVGPRVGALLAGLVESLEARYILEIGTFLGYGTLWLAEKLPDDHHGHLWTLEKEPARMAKAQGHMRRANLSSRVTCLLGDARIVLPGLDAPPHGTLWASPSPMPRKGSLDMVVIDADKPSYPLYVRWASAWLRSGGILVIDNMCLGGVYEITDAGGLRLSQPGVVNARGRRRHPPRPATVAAMAEVYDILQDERIFAGKCIDIGDGVAVYQKIA